MRCKTVVCSSIGKKRQTNQDNFCVNGYINPSAKKLVKKSFFKRRRSLLLAVCDGMGGEKHGEVASLMAAEALGKFYRKNKALGTDFENKIGEYIRAANAELCEYIKAHNNERMGTTLAALSISPEKGEAVAANVGDSKVYLFRGGELRKLSEDHNQAQTMVNMGIITEEEARTHRDKSKLTQYIGVFPEELILEAAISDTVELRRGDIFLLCSDGLTDMLTVKEIGEILGKGKRLSKACAELVAEAEARGGRDNITVILAQVK